MFRRIITKKNRALLSELVRTDFKLRYQGSVLGYAWSLLHPLMIFLILYVVFVKFLKLGQGIAHYPVYLLLGIVLWNFFRETTMQGLTSIVSRGDLLRKIGIPRWIIILSSSISSLINLFLNLVVISFFIAVNHVHLTSSVLWVPLILLEIYIFALGTSALLSALYVKYRDISYIWEVVIQGGFYLTPIIYPLSRITSLTFQKIILLNPMAQAVQDARYNMVTHQATTTSQIFAGGLDKFIPFILVLIISSGGILYFRKQSKYFAEEI